MASAMNGGGGGGALKRMGPLRLQYYIVMGAVAAAVVLATLRYMPGPAAAASSVVRPGASAAAAAPGAEAEAEAEDAEGESEKRKRKGDGVVLFNFGDSNSDTGGVAAVMGIRIAPPEGRAYFHHPTGRLSDGRVILDFICECSLLQSPISLLPMANSPALLCSRPMRAHGREHSSVYCRSRMNYCRSRRISSRLTARPNSGVRARGAPLLNGLCFSGAK